MTKPGRVLRAIALALLASGAGIAAGETAPAREPLIFASPIHAGCKASNARTCQIVVEPLTINIASGAKLALFQVRVDNMVVYDWRPDQSNPPPSSGTTYSPTRVALGFGVTCNKSHTVSLVGRDTGDATLFNLGSTSPIPCPAPLPALTFWALPPCRVVDTRNVAGPDAGAPALAPGETRAVATPQKCGIPPTAAAISVNLTITSPTAPGFVTLYPADGTRPLASSINFSPGQTRANNATLPLAVDASGFSVFNGSAGSVHFILDVNGFFE